jgi:hypothetical protein
MKILPLALASISIHSLASLAVRNRSKPMIGMPRLNGGRPTVRGTCSKRHDEHFRKQREGVLPYRSHVGRHNLELIRTWRDSRIAGTGGHMMLLAARGQGLLNR